jgi:hypothetical protein
VTSCCGTYLLETIVNEVMMSRSCAESIKHRVGKKTAGRSLKVGCTARFNVVIKELSGMAVVTYTQHRHVDAAGLPCHDAGVLNIRGGLSCGQSQERIDFVAALLVQGVAVSRIIERECHCISLIHELRWLLIASMRSVAGPLHPALP